jgi:hypothetical protein
MSNLQIARGAVFIAITLFLSAAPARAHCNIMNGPVITTAKAALDKGDVTPVLKWVKKQNEAEIKEAFTQTLAVRKQSAEAKELADRYFFETLVRVHRAGEGAPYTGLQPASAVEPGIEAADKALETGKIDDLVKATTDEIAANIRHRFERVTATKKDADKSVAAGREYVEAYVEFIHYVERLHETAEATHHEQTHKD